MLRYVKEDEIHERLFAVVPVQDSSGKGMNELLQAKIEEHGLKYEKIAGESFDGASNMRGEFNGLRSHIKNRVPDSVYIWCYSHVLNLCVVDCCTATEARNLFGTMNRISCFFAESHKRMGLWRQQVENTKEGQSKLKRLQKIGETRWWAKEKSLVWMFSGDDCLYLDAVHVLSSVENSSSFDSKLHLNRNHC